MRNKDVLQKNLNVQKHKLEHYKALVDHSKKLVSSMEKELALLDLVFRIMPNPKKTHMLLQERVDGSWLLLDRYPIDAWEAKKMPKKKMMLTVEEQQKIVDMFSDS